MADAESRFLDLPSHSLRTALGMTRLDDEVQRQGLVVSLSKPKLFCWLRARAKTQPPHQLLHFVLRPSNKCKRHRVPPCQHH
jgi:hypothetical protein